MKKLLLTAIALICFGASSWGQLIIGATPYNYTQNFNTFAGSLATMPSGWTTSASSFMGSGTGSGNQGGVYAFGSSGEFSLGGLRSGGTGNFTFTVTFQNNTGSTINALTLGWDYEKWRFVNTDSGFSVAGTGALAGNATIASKGYSGNTSGTTGTVAVTPVSSFQLTGLSIAQGATFGLTWTMTDGSSSDNGVAIDNFNLSVPAAVPEPSSALLLGAVSLGMMFMRRRRLA